MHIGIAGVGRMGTNIGLRLMECGHKLTVWNRTADKVRPLADAGATVAKTPAEVASAADLVITILTDSPAIDAVYHGTQGLLTGDVKGKVFVEMSTVPPEAAVALAPKVKAKGAAFVECTVGGSTQPARQGKLLGLIGGEAADVARARPVIDKMCRRALHGGPVGSGAILKFTVNLPLMIYWQALGEALAMCNTLTVDPKELLDFLTETSGAANVLKIRQVPIVAKMKGEPPVPPTFDVSVGIKDIKAMLEEGRKRGLDLPVLARTLECYEEAKRKGGGEEEISAGVAVYWANRNKR